MTSITRARVRVSEATAPPRAREPTLIEIGANGFAVVTRTVRDTNGPAADVPVVMAYSGDHKDTQVVVPKASDAQGHIKISLLAGSRPTTFVFSITVQNGEPVFYKVIVK